MTRRAVGAALAAVMALTTCSSDDDGDGDDGDDRPSDVTVTDAWARTSPVGATTGAVYFTIESDAPDTVQGVAVGPSIAGGAELHTSMVTTDGASTMQPLPEVALPAGDTVALAPNGDHVMLVDLAAPLAAGATFDVTLHFATAADQVVTVNVSDDAP